jgi:signal transduction histidine kinase/CHASE1-domain containing sensor protein/CheY-like chemotaxis protein
VKRLKQLFVLSHEWNVFLVLIFIIAISLFSWWTVKIHLEKEWSARLNSEVEKVNSSISREFYGIGHALLDTRAYFQLSGVPAPKSFQNYVDSSQLLRRFPGLQGIAYTQTVDKEQIPALEKKMQGLGYTDFKYWPPLEERGFYTSITLIQPEDWRNKKVLGYDMYSDARRKEAMDKAAETDTHAVTDPLILVQDEDTKDEGFLIYLPHASHVNQTGQAEPKKSLLGFVYAIIRTPRFFNGALGVPSFYNEKINFQVKVYNNGTKKLENLYERFPSNENAQILSEISLDKEIKVFDKTWILHVEPLPHFYNWYERYIPILFAIVTLIMLSIIFLALWSTQQFLKYSEKHKESLAQISKNKSAEITLFRKLNIMVADLSSAIEGNSLFEKFFFHLHDVFEVEDCVVFARESKGEYEKRFQHDLQVFPEQMTVPAEFDELAKEGFLSTQPPEKFAMWAHLVPAEVRQTLQKHCYYILRTVLHESGKQASLMVIMRGPTNLCDTKMKEYALLSAFGQFAMSYDKAILLQRAEDANLMKSSFLANMSHEIRTPLGVIIGYSEILAQDEIDPEDKIQIVNGIKRNGKDLARLIDDILDISKVEAGKLHFEMTQVNLENVVQEVKSIMDTRAIDKNIQFSTAKLSNVPNYIVTDDIRLKQILVNIVGNAVKFTDKGNVKLLYTVVKNDEGEEFLEFQVTDTGTGISEKNREGLFKPFSQGDVTSTRKYGGTGLGLALSKRLAELLGGDLFLLESSVGKGSTFCLRIPLRNAQAYAEPLKEDTLSGLNSSLEKKAERGIDWKALDLTSLLKGIRILLVEDSEDNQEIYAHFLRSAGAEVILAEDGEKAIESAFKYKPRLILMDIQIPKIDGKEATKAIRQRGFTAPIIALTAHALHDEIRSCLAAGCNGQITKPVAGELLVQEVYFYLNYKG